MPATSLDGQYNMHIRIMKRELTTVSVTKGMGIAPCGGRAGVALCVGGYGGRVVNVLNPFRVALLRAFERRARSAVCDILVMGGSQVKAASHVKMVNQEAVRAWASTEEASMQELGHSLSP